MKQIKEDQNIALLYESISQEFTSEEQARRAKQVAYINKHKAIADKYDKEFEIELDGEVYTVYANIDWSRQAVDHHASIGHYGVSGKDVYGNVPTSIDDMEAYYYDTEKDEDIQVTDPKLLDRLKLEVQGKLEDMEPEDVGYHERDYEDVSYD